MNLSNQILSITANTNKQSLLVYPNPAKDYLNINTQIKGEAVLYDINGRKTQKFDIILGDNKINVTPLPKSVYILKTTGDNFKETTKVVIE